MKNGAIQLLNVDPEEFKNEIIDGVIEKLEASQGLTYSSNQDDYVTKKEAASILGVSTKTIHEWSKKRILKAYRIGNSVRFKRNEIDETLKKSCET